MSLIICDLCVAEYLDFCIYILELLFDLNGMKYFLLVSLYITHYCGFDLNRMEVNLRMDSFTVQIKRSSTSKKGINKNWLVG